MGRERELLNSRHRGDKPYDAPADALHKRNAKFKATMLTKEEKEDPVWQHRILQRTKQIEFGKNTLGYDQYTTMVPRQRRRKGDPWTPNVELNVSKRSWEGIVKKWRRELHNWDPDVENDRVREAKEAFRGENAGGPSNSRRSTSSCSSAAPSFASVVRGTPSSPAAASVNEGAEYDRLLSSMSSGAQDGEALSEERLDAAASAMLEGENIDELLEDLAEAEAEVEEDFFISTTDGAEDSIDFLDRKLDAMLQTGAQKPQRKNEGAPQASAPAPAQEEEEEEESARVVHHKSWADLMEEEEVEEEEDITW